MTQYRPTVVYHDFCYTCACIEGRSLAKLGRDCSGPATIFSGITPRRETWSDELGVQHFSSEKMKRRPGF